MTAVCSLSTTDRHASHLPEQPTRPVQFKLQSSSTTTFELVHQLFCKSYGTVWWSYVLSAVYFCIAKTIESNSSMVQEQLSLPTSHLPSQPTWPVVHLCLQSYCSEPCTMCTPDWNGHHTKPGPTQSARRVGNYLLFSDHTVCVALGPVWCFTCFCLQNL